MLDEEMVYDLADLFKIFSDSTRLKILCSLFEGDLNVTEITFRKLPFRTNCEY